MPAAIRVNRVQDMSCHSNLSGLYAAHFLARLYACKITQASCHASLDYANGSAGLAKPLLDTGLRSDRNYPRVQAIP